MPGKEPVPGLPNLKELCVAKGFEDFGDYVEQADVEATITELTRWLLTERPDDPKQFMMEKYREMYPLEKFGVKDQDCEIGVEQFIRLFEATRNITHEIV